MPDDAVGQPAPILADRADFLIATAARAPSVQNTQPWRFRVRPLSIELHADSRRRLRVDPAGREMLISCGAALYGLRLGVRSLGFTSQVDLLPDPARPSLLARVSLGQAQPITPDEQHLLDAIPHRHTHRGPFGAGPLPPGLLPALQQDARAEGATLTLIDRTRGYERLADLVTAARAGQDADAAATADMQDWTHSPASHARDGVPATAFTTQASQHRSQLSQRDFDLGRRLGQLDASGPPPAATAILHTSGDDPGDWLCAGQALHRILARAASRWIFASLHTQPLENPAIRARIADQLTLAGAPQMILQLGPARITQATARRLPAELTDP